MRRREFISCVVGAAAWSPSTRAQQARTPVIGFLGNTSPNPANEGRLQTLRQGLKDSGFIEGENVTIVYRWAENQLDRLPELAAELVRLGVSVIAAPGGPAPTLAAKTATATIPVVFIVGYDPVALGLVASLARPSGNLTGVYFLASDEGMVAKRIQLLRELVPGAARVALLVNPAEAAAIESTLRGAETAARGLHILRFNASTGGEIDAAFASIVRDRRDALLVASSPFMVSRRVQLVLLAARHALPAIYAERIFADAGGLISYGADIAHAVRQCGVYIGRILKGAEPADLPVMQSSKFELVVNAQTAGMLNLIVPPSLLAHADEVIE